MTHLQLSIRYSLLGKLCERQKQPNKACAGLLDLCAFFGLILNYDRFPFPSLFSPAASGGGAGGRGRKPGKDKDLAGKLHKAWEEANSQAWEWRGGV